MDYTLVVLAVLLLLVSIRFAVLGIAFLTGDVEEQQVRSSVMMEEDRIRSS